MPKLVTAVPKYRKKRFKNREPQAVVTINGRDNYLGLYGSRASKVEYDRLINQWLASGRSPRFGLPDEQHPDVVVADLIKAYRIWAIKYYRHKDGTPTGTAENMRPLMRRLRQWYGTELVSQFTPLAFKDVIQRLVDEKLSISTVNDHIARIKHMFRWGVSEELVEESTLRRLETVSSEREGRSNAKPRKIVEAVSDEIIDRTLPKLPPIVRDMVKLQRLTGMRPNEVCLIRRCDIVGVDDVLIYTPQRHKTEHHGKDRAIVIAGRAIEVLRPYLTDNASAYCFSPRRTIEMQLAKRTAERVTPLSCGTTAKSTRKINAGNRYDSNSYRRAVHRACEAIWGKNGFKWSPNQLRHALAVEVQEVAGIEAVAAVHGHAKIDTSKLYAKHNLKLAIETMKIVTANTKTV